MPRNYADKSPVAYQRLPEYKREDDWIRSFLHEAKVGHIASSWDDQPFLNPSTFQEPIMEQKAGAQISQRAFVQSLAILFI
jgi:hypothetical protein